MQDVALGWRRQDPLEVSPLADESPVYEELAGPDGAEPVVFLPGAGWPGAEGLVLAAAASDRQWHLLDLPGYGRSAGIAPPLTEPALADWLSAYADRRHLARVHVVGHSLGGYVGLVWARYCPDRVASLALLDTGHLRLPRLTSQPGAVGYLAPLLSGIERLVGMRRLAGRLPALTDPEPTQPLEERVSAIRARGWYPLADDQYLRAALAYEPAMTVDALSLSLRLYRAHPPRLLAHVSMPTLLVYSTRPRASDAEQRGVARAVARVCQANPLVTAVPVNGGHYVHWVDPTVPDRVAAHIRQAADRPN